MNISWDKRYISNDSDDSQWINLINYSLQHIAGKFGFRCMIHVKEIDGLRIKSLFWKDVLKCWCEYFYTQDIDQEYIGKQIIWLNSGIKVDNKILYNADCINNQLWTVDQLYYDNQLMDRNLINIIYDVNLTVMEYNSLTSAIPRNWKRHMLQNPVRDNVQVLHNKYEQLTFMPQKMVSKYVYAELICQIAESVNLQGKWMQYIPSELNDIEKWPMYIYKITIDNVLRSFQYKLLHRIIYFNDKLLMFGITNDSLCDACNSANDSIEHRLWLCPLTQLLWRNIIQWYNQFFDQAVTITYVNVISNICNNTHLLEFVVLCTKYYIYKSFLKKSDLNVKNLIDEILYLEKIEKDIAYKKGKIQIHCNKWGMLATA